MHYKIDMDEILVDDRIKSYAILVAIIIIVLILCIIATVIAVFINLGKTGGKSLGAFKYYVSDLLK